MMPSRRTTIQWMMTAAVLPMARWSPPAMAMDVADGVAPPFGTVADWPEVPALAPTKGYGRDPNLTEPKVAWPLTFSTRQRKAIDLLGDLILPADGQSPAAGKLGVGAFIDEWISAPYPIQQADRQKVIGGLGWLDAQSRLSHGAAFDTITTEQRARLLEALSVDAPVARMMAPVAFMDTLRTLFVLGFYTLPEGKADMGYIGDQPSPGAYPGPSKEALDHFAGTLDRMGLQKSSA